MRGYAFQSLFRQTETLSLFCRMLVLKALIYCTVMDLYNNFKKRNKPPIGQMKKELPYTLNCMLSFTCIITLWNQYETCHFGHSVQYKIQDYDDVFIVTLMFTPWTQLIPSVAL